MRSESSSRSRSRRAVLDPDSRALLDLVGQLETAAFLADQVRLNAQDVAFHDKGTSSAFLAIETAMPPELGLIE